MMRACLHSGSTCKQGNGSVMTGALTCANGGGWCGWGVPSTPGRMVGASAIIVKTCNSCPTGVPVQHPCNVRCGCLVVQGIQGPSLLLLHLMSGLLGFF